MGTKTSELYKYYFCITFGLDLMCNYNLKVCNSCELGKKFFNISYALKLIKTDFLIRIMLFSICGIRVRSNVFLI